MAKSYAVQMLLTGRDQASGAIRGVRQQLAGLRASAAATARSFGMHRVTDGFRGLFASLGGLRSQITGLFGPLLAFTGLAGAAFAGRMVHGAVLATENMAKLARMTGLGVEAFQRWQFAAGQAAGMTESEFAVSMRTFAKSVGEAANGTGEARMVFKALGIELKDGQGRIRDTADLLKELNGRFANIGDAVTATAAAQKLFGESGGRMSLLLRQQGTELEGLFDQATRFGLVTEGQATAAEEYVDALGRLDRAFTGLKTLIGAQVIPVIAPLLDGLTGWLAANRALVASGVSAWMRDLSRTLFGVATGWREVNGEIQVIRSGGIDFAAWGRGIARFASGVQTLVGWIGGWRNAAIALAAFMAAPFVAALLSVTVATGRLGLAVGAAALKMGGFALSAQVATWTRFAAAMRRNTGIVKAFMLAWRANPVGLVLTAIELLIALGAVLYQKFKPFRDLVDWVAAKLLAISDLLTFGMASELLKAVRILNSQPDAGSAPGGAAAPGAPLPLAPALPRPQATAAGATGRAEVVLRVEGAQPGMRLETRKREGGVQLDTRIDYGSSLAGVMP